MARYIDSEALTEEIKSLSVMLGGENVFKTAKESVLRIIDEQPTADVVEVKHGEWIIDTSIEERTFYESNYKILITCSICGNRHFLGTQPYRNFTQEDLKEDSYRKYRYCGQCGAKMDGRRDT